MHSVNDKRPQQLFDAMSGGQRPMILIHGNPDPDALAGAWALREVLRAREVSARIVYTGEVGRPENEAMIRLLRIPAEPSQATDIGNADRIAIVDAQPGFFRGIDLPRCDVVVDHHPPRLDRHVRYSDIRPKCLATASVMTEYVRESGIAVSRRLATALYYGIDTDGRRRNAPPTATDRHAVEFLTRKVDWLLLRRIEFSSYSLARLDYFSIALVRLRYAGHVLYSNVGPVPSTDVCAQIADFLMRVKEANWTLVCGVVGRTLVVVFRCDGQRRHAGQVAEKAFAPFGSAGGHRTMGRAEIDESDMPGRILLTETEKVDAFVLNSLAAVAPVFRSLLRKAYAGRRVESSKAVRK